MNQDESLIFNDCDVYIPMELNNFVKEKYNQIKLKKYIGN